MARITQAQMIEKHLIDKGHITGREAWDIYSVYRLSEVIRKLRAKGDVIHTTMLKNTNKFGIEYEYAEYIWGIQPGEVVPFMGESDD